MSPSRRMLKPSRARVAVAGIVVMLVLLPLAWSTSTFAAADLGGGGRRRGLPSFAAVGLRGGGSVDGDALPQRVPFTTKPRGGARTAASSSSDPPPSSSSSKASSVEVRANANANAAGAANETEDFSNAPVSQVGQVTDREEPLIHNIELLGDILSEIVKSEDPQVHSLFEEFRQYGFARAAESTSSATHASSSASDSKGSGDNKASALAASESMARALDKMVARAAQLTAKEALGLMRSFSIMLNLVNSAEVQHRQRRIRQREAAQDAVGGPLPLVEDSVRGTMDALLAANMATPDQLYRQLVQQRVEIVLTAHPTEVQRKSLLRKYSQVSELLGYLDRPDLSAFERASAHSDLKRIISSIWGADEIRRTKPTPQQEAGGGNAVLESVLWDAVPSYLRKLDAQCRMTLNRRLPIDVVPIKFASWIGGDRDGNPNVTPQVTKEVILQQKLRASRLFLSDLYELLSELAISYRFSPEMRELAATITDSHHNKEKYRRVIGHLIKRMLRTARDCEAELAVMAGSVGQIKQKTVVDETDGWQDVEPFRSSDELMKPLRIMYDSLEETGFGLIADGKLVDIIRRLAVFGLSMVPLDIREESTKHTEALDAITRWLGTGSYKEWSEEARLNWLTSELSSKRPLFRIRDVLESNLFDPAVMTTLRTFHMASDLHPETLGAYVISQAQSASDVLAVMLLQKQFGMTAAKGNMMRVVPLFETLDDLNNAPGVLETLFTIPVYVGAIKGEQEVMVGYSDSAKDAGRLAACWAQYISQEEMVKVAEKHSIKITFFHGKGGTVSRGGNPSVYRAILSHPPNTIRSRFRVTEQGEMITQNFGTQAIAERSLDTYTAAICREAFTKHVEPKKKWREQMEKISNSSCAEYRFLVREEPRFVPYFRQATPELELGSMNIGSRPAKRNPKGGIESLRAIPWSFAWTQTRTHLPAWLGVGEGLHAANGEELTTLREMYKEWPWFRENIDLICMILSKTDYSIATNYDKQLVNPEGGLLELGEEVRSKLVQTRLAVLNVTESKDYAGAHVALMRASNVIRFPFLDPVNVCQAEILKRLRALNNQERLSEAELEEKFVLGDALILSISGIAQGLRNSG